MANQKIVLKLRFPEDQTFYAKGDAEYKPVTITQWNYRRIGAAVMLFGGVIAATGYSVFHSDPDGPKNVLAATGDVAAEVEITNSGETDDRQGLISAVPDKEAAQKTDWNEEDAAANNPVNSVIRVKPDASPDAEHKVQYASDATRGIPETRESHVISGGKPETATVVAGLSPARYSNENTREVHNEQAVTQTTPALSSGSSDKDTAELATAQGNAMVGSSPFVSRSLLAGDVINLEPVSRLGAVLHAEPDRAIQVSFFTELNDLSGQSVSHEWRLNGKKIFRKQFNVRGDRWRIYTQKLVNTAMLGDWEVMVSKADGEVLDVQRFQLLPPLSSNE